MFHFFSAGATGPLRAPRGSYDENDILKYANMTSVSHIGADRGSIVVDPRIILNLEFERLLSLKNETVIDDESNKYAGDEKIILEICYHSLPFVTILHPAQP